MSKIVKWAQKGLTWLVFTCVVPVYGYALYLNYLLIWGTVLSFIFLESESVRQFWVEHSGTLWQLLHSTPLLGLAI